jgi:hypothetical protein
MENDLLARNAFLDAQDIVREHEVPFVSGDLVQHKDHGIDLQAAAGQWLKQYEGTDKFLLSVKDYFTRKGGITQGQAVSVLNNWRKAVRLDQPGTVTESKKLECFSCDDGPFDSWDELNAHKSQMHGKVKPPEVFAEVGEAKAVLEVTDSKMGLDLSNLPDGRYAAPDTSGKHDNVFIMVKRVQVTKPRDRRYEAYGRVISGNEIVVAGTIEVKLWSSDSKELVGEQKPGDVYRGQLEEELDLIMLFPEQMALLFGRLMKHCARCGKKLTDEVSQNIGLGLDCEKYIAQNYFKLPPKYTFIGTSRPTMDKYDPNDEAYLSKKMTRYVEPPKVKPPTP